MPHRRWARDFWGFNSAAQWFANRGYACLQVNYRGSSGYGKSFLHKGDKEWGVGAMQHDLTDAVKWAVDSGIADPDNVCIYGGSYGGYACLAGLTFTPDLYKCGVDIVGARPASFLNWRSRGFGTSLTPSTRSLTVRLPRRAVEHQDAPRQHPAVLGPSEKRHVEEDWGCGRR